MCLDTPHSNIPRILRVLLCILWVYLPMLCQLDIDGHKLPHFDGHKQQHLARPTSLLTPPDPNPVTATPGSQRWQSVIGPSTDFWLDAACLLSYLDQLTD